MAKRESKGSLFTNISKDLGVDLGSANTLIFVKDEGVALREASCIAIDETSREIIATGKEAREMLGKAPESVEAVCPVKRGVVADFDACAAMLRQYVKKACGTGVINKPRIVMAVPSGITEVERRAAEDAAKRAGAGSVSLMEAPLAAAIGAGLAVSSSKGFMVLNAGSGITEAAVIALGDIVCSTSVRTGTGEMTESIIKYIKRKHGLVIGSVMAEDVLVKLGSAFPTEESFTGFMDVKGRSVADNLPKSITIHSEEIREAVSGVLSLIAAAVIDTMENTPPELASDIMETGIMLTGGAAELSGLDKYIAQESGLNVKIAERPTDCVAEGLGRSLGLILAGRETRKNKRSLR